MMDTEVAPALLQLALNLVTAHSLSPSVHLALLQVRWYAICHETHMLTGRRSKGMWKSFSVQLYILLCFLLFATWCQNPFYVRFTVSPFKSVLGLYSVPCLLCDVTNNFMPVLDLANLLHTFIHTYTIHNFSVPVISSPIVTSRLQLSSETAIFWQNCLAHWTPLYRPLMDETENRLYCWTCLPTDCLVMVAAWTPLLHDVTA